LTPEARFEAAVPLPKARRGNPGLLCRSRDALLLQPRHECVRFAETGCCHRATLIVRKSGKDHSYYSILSDTPSEVHLRSRWNGRKRGSRNRPWNIGVRATRAVEHVRGIMLNYGSRMCATT